MLTELRDLRRCGRLATVTWHCRGALYLDDVSRFGVAQWYLSGAETRRKNHLAERQ